MDMGLFYNFICNRCFHQCNTGNFLPLIEIEIEIIRANCIKVDFNETLSIRQAA